MKSGRIVEERVGPYEVRRRNEVATQAVLEALDTPGQVLKKSSKAVTRRVGDWVVKESRSTVRQRAKQALRPGAYLRAWKAALLFETAGVGSAKPIALVRRRKLGAIVGSALIFEHLDGSCSVEQWAARMHETGASEKAIRGFLSKIAQAVARLCDTGAYHADLSGKNILTRNGDSFYFIDLDGVELNREYTDALQLKNHIQLYDSFCDLWSDDVLAPFVTQMLPRGTDADVWMEAVRRGQAKRRARTKAIWRKQGKR
ncbi:MAG: hypothetical protein HZB26_06100 [Candidatus Hydrogenedentes bacterium]|nr:hypothetical protein [Candidatus Hydrogenedentota bacterium]